MPSPPTALRDHVCLYASFDQGFDADSARGDRKATVDTRWVRHLPEGGRSGGALWFDAHTPPDHDEFTFPAAGNFPYRSTAFDGAISVWWSLDPDADLEPSQMVDPFHISRTASDASYYLDLTRLNDPRYGSPRKLRLGLYSDSPARDRFVGGQLIVVGELNWRADAWHHVVATWRNVNSGQDDGAAAVYIDGVRRGWMEGYRHQVTWEVATLRIGLGQRYAGLIDEVVILDRDLAAEEVAALYRLPGPLAEAL